ncbi:phosphonopyruvate decarboxylase [Eubacteriales bacterium OttesenSCG-928-A19]|nr:phosphonopyruvate decarboxylase [Eubacteriales bacterium OttesenSCG-928-A19]
MNMDFIKDYDFFTGVPDSQLQPLCNCLMHTYGIGNHHIIAANEGNSVAVAAGYHLATGKIPVIYLQNSGIGNIVNPVASLLHRKVYGVPMIFVVGWRGEPGVHDEPQHIFQGEITKRLLEDLDMKVLTVGPEPEHTALKAELAALKPWLAEGGSIAIVVRKGALRFDEKVAYKNAYTLNREAVIGQIVDAAADDLIVSTTGKISRELYEIRESRDQGHGMDFLTVGSMGHASSIALGIALQKPEAKVWCIDGDGAALMHMGAMAVIGANAPKNLIHIVLNNGAHETVGGMPTVASSVDWVKVAEGCGYPSARSMGTADEVQGALREVRQTRQLCLLEIQVALGSRADLGRPKTSAQENKLQFMRTLAQK